jgi:hypothetical protein
MIRLQHIDNNHPNATAKDAQNAMSQHWRTSVARVGDEAISRPASCWTTTWSGT